MSKLKASGDVCQTCYNIWAHRKLEPKRLKNLYDAAGNVITTDNGIPIVICEYCDGQFIFDLPGSHNRPDGDTSEDTDSK